METVHIRSDHDVLLKRPLASSQVCSLLVIFCSILRYMCSFMFLGKFQLIYKLLQSLEGNMLNHNFQFNAQPPAGSIPTLKTSIPRP
jgi:hypothetical protein